MTPGRILDREGRGAHQGGQFYESTSRVPAAGHDVASVTEAVTPENVEVAASMGIVGGLDSKPPQMFARKTIFGTLLDGRVIFSRIPICHGG